jgi:fibronectin type 3 domain-containing protein
MRPRSKHHPSPLAAATLTLIASSILFTQPLFGAPVSLAWDANPEPDISGYRIHYGAVSGLYSGSLDVGNVTSAIVPDLIEATTYYFTVTAYNTAGLESLPSNEVSVFFSGSDTSPPVPPGSLVAVAGDGLISLDWSDSSESNFASYTLYRSASSGAGYVAIASGLVASSYVDSDVVNGTANYYVVTASDTAGNESGTSNESTATSMDMLAPFVNLTTGSPTVAGEFDVTLEFSEAVSGLELTDFVIDGGFASALTGGSASYTTTISPTNFGVVTVVLPAGATSDAAGNGNLSSNSLSVTYQDPNGNPTPQFATGETTQRGSVSGSSSDLAAGDDVYERLTEISSGGKPSLRFSQLQHTWTFSISGPNPVLHIEAFHDVSADGDDFVFSYSVDGINFTDAITVTATADDDQAQTASLGNASGTVTVRVDDSNHLPGSNTHFDTLYVDALFIETGSGGGMTNTSPSFDGDPIDERDAIVGQAYVSTLADNASDADGDDLVFFKLDGPAWLTVGGDGSLSGFPGAADLGDNQFTVGIDDGNGGVGSTKLNVRVVPVGGLLETFVSDIGMNWFAGGGNRYGAMATITVLDQTGAAVSGATVSVNWSGATTATDSAVTDGNGIAVIESGLVKNGGTFVLTVGDIRAPGFSYKPSLNVEATDSIIAP